jgi:hypothetical protein
MSLSESSSQAEKCCWVSNLVGQHSSSTTYALFQGEVISPEILHTHRIYFLPADFPVGCIEILKRRLLSCV